jgi:hypothetical protein
VVKNIIDVSGEGRLPNQLTNEIGK